VFAIQKVSVVQEGHVGPAAGLARRTTRSVRVDAELGRHISDRDLVTGLKASAGTTGGLRGPRGDRRTDPESLCHNGSLLCGELAPIQRDERSKLVDPQAARVGGTIECDASVQLCLDPLAFYRSRKWSDPLGVVHGRVDMRDVAVVERAPDGE
jgi:hypothetical protein